MTKSTIVLINPNNNLHIGNFSHFTLCNSKQLTDEEINSILPTSSIYPGAQKSIIHILRKEGCLYYPGIHRSIIHNLK